MKQVLFFSRINFKSKLRSERRVICHNEIFFYYFAQNIDCMSAKLLNTSMRILQ